jgi:hypothetical protein
VFSNRRPKQQSASWPACGCCMAAGSSKPVVSRVGAFSLHQPHASSAITRRRTDTHKQQVYSSFGLELARQHVVLLHATLLAALSNLAERSCPLTLRRWLARLSTRELHARRPRQPQPISTRMQRFELTSKSQHMFRMLPRSLDLVINDTV